MPDTGHGVIFKNCARIITDNFLGNPYSQPDMQCIDEIEPVVFYKPGIKSTPEKILDSNWKPWPFLR